MKSTNEMVTVSWNWHLERSKRAGAGLLPGLGLDERERGMNTSPRLPRIERRPSSFLSPIAVVVKRTLVFKKREKGKRVLRTRTKESVNQAFCFLKRKSTKKKKGRKAEKKKRQKGFVQEMS